MVFETSVKTKLQSILFWGLTQISSKMMDFGDFANLEQNDCYVAAKILGNFFKKKILLFLVVVKLVTSVRVRDA